MTVVKGWGLILFFSATALVFVSTSANAHSLRRCEQVLANDDGNGEQKKPDELYEIPFDRLPELQIIPIEEPAKPEKAPPPAPTNEQINNLWPLKKPKKPLPLPN